ncbi:MAG: ATP-dependent DNA helicase RecQ [Bacteroidota bacterium]
MPAPATADLFASGDVASALQEHFGFDTLRQGQEEALRPVLAGHDTLVVMPTGAGKSLVYQLAALMGEGVTVVISPLIALMKDQVDALRQRDVAAAYVNSSQTQAEQREALDDLKRGRLRLVYVAPERLRVPSFVRALREARVGLLAVDEAHCVSQWGHDFRPDYLAIGSAREAMGAPPCVALTATATPRVQNDIASQLGLQDPARIVTGFNRPNLFFDVRSTPTAKLKRQALRAFLDERAGDPGLIYVATRKECEDLARFLREEVGRPCEAYHAGLPDRERSDVQEQFVSARLDLVVATNAFGMGVDRADVRFVAHWSIPSNLESYYQEAGRAGRDRQPASAVLFYAPQDRQLKEWFIEQGVPTLDDLRRVHRYVERRNPLGAVRDESAPYSATDVDFVEEMSEALKVHVSRLPNMLSRLRRAGVLSEREGEMGASRWRAERWDGRAVKGALSAIEAHRDEQMDNLFGIVGYAQTGDCRRRRILDHFGDSAETDVPPEVCCDACRVRARLEGAEAPDEIPDWDALPMNSRVALGLLDAVTRMRWPVGRVTLSKILAGSKAKGMEKYERHPYYGRLQMLGQSEVDGIYKQLLMQNYLRMGGGEYPVVELTPRGEQALAHREALEVEVPAFGTSTSSRSRSVGAAAAVELDSNGEALFERLRAWRTALATEKAVPPYVIFSDKTLRALASARPDSEDAMLAVKGVGPAKYEAYGEAVMEIVAERASSQ